MKPPSISPAQYVARIDRVYADKADPATAEGQMRYMRNRYAYHGLKAPQWVALLKEMFAQYGLYDGQELRAFVRQCFESEYREIHYAGLQMLEKRIKKQPPEAIDFLEECICTESWWDTVDWLNKLVGIHFKRYPDLQRPIARRWVESDNFWLQRVATIHQLTFKSQTDFHLMCEMILRRAESKEFFVQKAQGWALRQYSKYDAESVAAFVNAHPELSSLTRREALKWLERRR
jgi:3-methyladenine DNA glycosylase AlkD